MGRIAIAKEVADLAVFLCSNRSGFSTGQALGMDGGCITH
ncbi:SDR family oxidoreductase [Ulvibacterium sp.]